MRWIDMHDKPVNKIENKTEEREEDTEKFYVAEEGVPLYICDQNALIAYYGSEIELNRTIVSPRGDGIYSARLPLLDVGGLLRIRYTCGVVQQAFGRGLQE